MTTQFKARFSFLLQKYIKQTGVNWIHVVVSSTTGTRWTGNNCCMFSCHIVRILSKVLFHHEKTKSGPSSSCHAISKWIWWLISRHLFTRNERNDHDDRKCWSDKCIILFYLNIFRKKKQMQKEMLWSFTTLPNIMTDAGMWPPKRLCCSWHFYTHVPAVMHTNPSKLHYCVKIFPRG